VSRAVEPVFTLSETTFWNRAAFQMRRRPVRLVELTDV
jgi:hypothetical protein